MTSALLGTCLFSFSDYNVGTDHDTAAFAVESIRRWWKAMGQPLYPGADKVLICADSGGSNGYRTCEKSIAQAHEQFKHIKDYVMGEAQTQDAYTVEKRLFKEGMQMLLCFMGGYFEKKRGGHMGDAIVLENGQTLPRERLNDKRHITVFGELLLKRWYYHEDGDAGFYPLDENTNLPERSCSYYVQELLGQNTTNLAYEGVMADLKKLFGFTPHKHSVEDMVRDAARDVQGFWENLPPPAPETEASIVAAMVDGKGVPMVKDEPAQHKVRLGPGEKLSHKKEATVGTVSPSSHTGERPKTS